MRIRWQRLASRDAITAVAFVAEIDADAGNRLGIRIADGIGQLRDFPESGQEGPRANTRELYLTGTSYRIVYRITKDELVVIRILHTSRKR